MALTSSSVALSLLAVATLSAVPISGFQQIYDYPGSACVWLKDRNAGGNGLFWNGQTYIQDDVIGWPLFIVGCALFFVLVIVYALAYRFLRSHVYGLVHRQIFPPPPTSGGYWSSFRSSMLLSFSELVWLAWTVIFFVFAFLYMYGHGYINAKNDLKGDVARGLGAMAAAGLILVLMPIYRNSIWTLLFGVPFERALRFHRWIGRAFWFFTTVHGVVMWVWTMADGCGPDYIIRWEVPKPHGPPIFGLMAWVCATVMLVTTYFRRSHYEWFLYAHMANFMLVLLFSWIHFESIGIFILIPLVALMVDSAFRMWYMMKAGSVKKVIHHKESGITELRMQKAGFKWKAGDYAWIHLGGLQLHPFTISSWPGQYEEGTFTMHIKDMGEGTFTHGVASVTEGRKVRIDGPYGMSPSLAPNTSAVFLIACGIGITPLLSICGDIFNNSGMSGVQKLIFSVTVRNSDALKPFNDILKTFQSMAAEKKVSFEYIFITNCTQESSRDVELTEVNDSAPLPVTNGRPNYEELLKQYAPSSGNANVLACGPEAMVVGVESIAHQLSGKDTKYYFHKEVFLF